MIPQLFLLNLAFLVGLCVGLYFGDIPTVWDLPIGEALIIGAPFGMAIAFGYFLRAGCGYEGCMMKDGR